MRLQDHIFIKSAYKIFAHLDKFLANHHYQYTQIIFVTDSVIWQANQHLFPKKFLSKFSKTLILDNPKADEDHAQIIAKNSQDCLLILGFGSGTINDLCKYVASRNNQKYAILISALSMNGYASKNASITINQHKKTLEATLPIAIFADLTILKNAPHALNKAGLADVLCFYSCNFDLQLNRLFFLQKIPLRALNLQWRTLNNFIKQYGIFKFNDSKFLKILLKMILNSGWAMTIANSSAPASQSEHLLAHVLTMKFPHQTQHILHGRLIASTTIWSLQQQYEILSKKNGEDFSRFLKTMINFRNNSKNFLIQSAKYFGEDITRECSNEFNAKLEYLYKNHHKIIKNYQKKWSKIYCKLSDLMINPHFLMEVFRHFEVDYSFENIGFTTSQINEAWHNCKYIRNRLTITDLVIHNG